MYEAKRVFGKSDGKLRRYVIVPVGADPTAENAVGLLEKYPNTRTDWHPWKAFKGVGESVEFIGWFYNVIDWPRVRDSFFDDDGMTHGGGAPAAIQAVSDALADENTDIGIFIKPETRNVL